ncbi:MAG: maltose alpha-D-glucosyltransferase [Candidatus Caenarcaniphilales bacterium]|nr:maltose alpha-D-glucosyltransferase [Candidatus Caenarcaniphilales bacterium]
MSIDKHSDWYKDAVFYELHVKAFYDSTNDGIGDFNGLTEKLDYLKDLGVDCIWLLPFYPSPQKDDGYDIADYYNVNPPYGSVKDFQRFIKAAHKRGLRVIADLVLNHTSDQHSWFQEALLSKKSKKRDYYVWSKTDQRYKDARIIFVDTETSNWSWSQNTQEYYWHRFFSHQPDLNFENPRVQKAMQRVMYFWLDLGLDGFRCDAVPYLFEEEGTNCENLPKTHQFLKDLRKKLDNRYPDKVLLAEANQWPEDVRPYFGDGDEFHMAFHFPLMPRLFMSLIKESSKPITEIMSQTPDIPENCQWGLFLRNHDELTLEMVTDEERDYMYKEYAKEPRMRCNVGIRRRLAPLLDNDRDSIELLNSMLFTLPGSPVIYYGDEIGMGDNIYLGDRNGVRTPMQWSIDRNGGFSRCDYSLLYQPVIADPVYGYQSVNVEAQNRTPSSLLNWMKKMIKTRKKYKAFGRGTLEFQKTNNSKILCYFRKYQEEIILIINNLSKTVQAVEVKLDDYRGFRLIELTAENDLPLVEDKPYFFTLPPRGYYWFKLVPVTEEAYETLQEMQTEAEHETEKVTN